MLPPQQPSIGGSLSWRAPVSPTPSPVIGRVARATAASVRSAVHSVASSTSAALSSSTSFSYAPASVPETATQRPPSSLAPRVASTLTTTTSSSIRSTPTLPTTTTSHPPTVTLPNSVVGSDVTPRNAGSVGCGGLHTIRAILEQLYQQLQTHLRNFQKENPIGRFIASAVKSFSERVMWLVSNITSGTESSLDAGVRLVVVGIALLLCGRFAVCHARRCLRGNKKKRPTSSPGEEELIDVADVVQDDGIVGNVGSNSDVGSEDDGGDLCSASPCRNQTSIPAGIMVTRRRDSYYTPARGGGATSAAAQSQASPSSPAQPTTPVHFIPEGVSAAFYSLFLSPTSATPPPPPQSRSTNTHINIISKKPMDAGDEVTSENDFEVIEREGYIETYDVRAERERRRAESEKERRLSERYGCADEHVERLIASYSGATMPSIAADDGHNDDGDAQK